MVIKTLRFLAALVIILGITLSLTTPSFAAPSKAAFTNCNNVTEILPAECNALVSLYDNNGGASWSNHTGWKVTDTPCSWYGVQCTANHVTNVSLQNNNLTGTLPTALGNLTSIQTLWLPGNSLSGSIPSQIGTSCTSLVTLNLSSNQFSSTIPTTLGNLTNLSILNLLHNELTGGIPTQLGSMTALTELYLGDNQLTGSIIPQLGSLSNLVIMELEWNQFTGGLPTELQNLKKLERFWVYHNTLSGVLSTMDMSGMSSIKSFYVNFNNFTGNIPGWFSTMTTLTNFDLAYNQFTGEVPVDLFQAMPNLEEIYLRYNNLTGPLPNMHGLTHMDRIRVNNNNFTGGIPDYLDKAHFPVLRWLFLNDNPNLGGAIPGGIGTLDRVTDMDLSNCGLTGHIPNLNGMSIVQYVLLQNNQLEDPLTTGSLNAIPTVVGLNLSSNHLTGSTVLADVTGNLTLNYLYLQGNLITTSLPSNLGNLTSLLEFDASNNQLSGSLPSSIGSMTNLNVLNLNHNQLTGTIPTNIGSMSHLVTLNLSYNLLTGNIPSQLGNLGSTLQHIYVEYNTGMSGMLPTSLDNLPWISVFHFNNTSLCESPDVTFQTWLAGIGELQRTAICNNAPTNISLDNTHVAEKLPMGWKVGSLSSTDADPGETFTYTLVTNPDNTSFTIDGSTLRTNATFDHALKPSYTLRIRTTDHGGLYYEKEFPITIDVLDPSPAAVLVDPANGSTIDNFKPTYRWNKPGIQTYYKLAIFDSGDTQVFAQWYTFSETLCPATQCSVTPDFTLGAGAYTWYIKSINPNGGAWTSGATFSTPGAPQPPTLVSPISNVTTANWKPTYTWSKISAATRYRLYVSNTSTVYIDQIYELSGVTCNDTQCSVTPDVELGSGSYDWYVRSGNANGYSAWSAKGTFQTPAPAAKPTLITPTGTSDSFLPTYTWNLAARATQYKLVVYDAGNAVIISTWYSTAQASCGTDCHVTPDTALGKGTYSWEILSNNPTGGQVSDRSTFTTPQTAAGVPTLVTPANGSTAPSHNLTYTWNKVDTATNYKLYVVRSDGVILHSAWYTPAQANCGGSTCAVTPSATLESNTYTYTWYVKSYNPVGGAWSTGNTFTPPAAAEQPILVRPIPNPPEQIPSGDISWVFTWKPGTGGGPATLYKLVYYGPNGIYYAKWVSSSEASCTPTQCQYATGIVLTDVGAYRWYVKAFNPSGGAWSAEGDFTIY